MGLQPTNIERIETMKHRDSYEYGLFTGLILSVLFLVFLSPFITIWSVNTLFGNSIPINLWTYLATLWLTGLVAGSSVRSK